VVSFAISFSSDRKGVCMSAIAGLIDWRGGPAGPSVRKALEALALHGRDGEGLWDGGNVALGWRQTILHKEDYAEKQPLTGGGGALKLVFDGRIDNREDLARALTLSPESAREWPDSAYVLAAFEKWGEECVPHLLGDFAFAIWNADKRMLFLARDHIGTRPLYFHRGEHFVMFATQPSALFTNPRVPRDIDDEKFLLDLAAVPFNPGETLYRGIERVPIGNAVILSEKEIVTSRHWQPESIPELRYKNDNDYVEEFKSILDEAVRCRLRTIHPIGSHLSSGWDSSTVAAVAAGLLAGKNGKLTAFTAVPPEKWRAGAVTAGTGPTDEGPIAKAVAQMYPNIEHVLVRGSGRLDLDALDRHADAFEYPKKTINNIGWMESLYSEARNRGIRVMLSGGMGNRTVSHDGLTLLPYLLRHGDILTLSREWRALSRDTYTHKRLATLTFGPYLPEFVWQLLRWGFKRPRRTIRMRTGVNPNSLSEEYLWKVARFRGTNPANAYRADDRVMRYLCTQTPDLGLLWGGSLADYDVQTLDPTADRRLMVFRAAIPERQFLRNGEAKWLVRRAMRNKLPDLLFNQAARGQQAAEWFDAASASRHELNTEVERLSANPRMGSLVDIPLLQNLMRRWPSQVSNASEIFLYRRLLIIVSSARFVRRFIEH
jgi:asparagine synthase (glutamine-hydrolysing)